MRRPTLLLPAIAAALALGSTPITPAPPSRAAAPPQAGPAAESDPLTVAIEGLTPSVVPTKGPLIISGQVTNNSTDQWRAINVYALASATPILTAAELSEATRSDPADQVGERITESGAFVTIDELNPGESAVYSLRVKQSDLPFPDTAGVYWLGVHALGETDEGRDVSADGKARTFLPKVLPKDGSIDAALVVPIRREVRHEPDGSVSDAAAWAADLRGNGRLAALLDFGTAAGSRSLTWLVDPAVPDAIAAFGRDNPARFLGRTVRDPGTDPSTSPSPSDGESPVAEDEAKTASGASSAESSSAELLAARIGRTWLDRAATTLTGDQVLSLAYGDPDVAAAAEFDRTAYRLARRRAGREIESLGLTTTPAVAPPSGFLDPQGLDLVPTGTTILVTSTMIEGDAPTLARTLDRRLVVARKEAILGGPGPGPRRGVIDTRQRILSEAALRLLADEGPLVVSFPADWTPPTTPNSAAGFFAGLDVSWLNLTTLRSVGTRAATPLNSTKLRYPPRQENSELDTANFAAARDLIGAGRRLDTLLPLNDTVADQVSDEALSATSYAARQLPNTTRTAADNSRAWIEELLAAVTVEAPPSVTLGDNGRFSANVTNGLDYPVRVALTANTDAELDITDSEAIDLGPQESVAVLMEARSSVLGAHEVDLVVTDEDGRPLGSTATFPLRTAQVSDVIWVVIGAGGLILFTAIAARLYRRIRNALGTRKATA